MATFRKRGKTWQAQVIRKIDGERVCFSETFPTKAHAQAWATEKEAELLGLKRSGLTRTISQDQSKTLGDAIDRFITEVSPSRAGGRWESIRLKFLMREAPELANTSMHKLTPEDVARWRDKRLKTVSTSTVRRELNLISSVIEQARREWRWCSINPVRDVRKPPSAHHREQRISEAEAMEIAGALGFVEGAQPRTLAAEVGLMFLLAIETGMRSGEMVNLTWAHVHLDRKYLRLPKTKNGTAREVPLFPRAVDLLSLMRGRYDDGRVFGVSDKSRDVFFRRYRPEHLSHIHFHDTRHEAVSRLSKMPGMNVMRLARMIGHKDIKNLMIYYAESATDMIDDLM